jgi:hypothetical protein
MAATEAPDLVIRIKKNADGSGALTAVRRDGSTTWQRQKQTVGAFFALHDLTHYAVETALRYDNAFYGLLAGGWNLSDFGLPAMRGKMPPAALAAELIVGFLDTERASGTRWTAADFNEKTRTYYEQHGVHAPPVLTDGDLENIRAQRSALFTRWDNIAPGGTLELTFNRSRRG